MRKGHLLPFPGGGAGGLIQKMLFSTLKKKENALNFILFE